MSGAVECISCASYGEMHFSNTGRACGTCAPGTEPNDERHECVDCGAGEYSDGGQCAPCAAGTQPNNDQSACDPCLAIGSNQFSSDGIVCEGCPAGTEPFDNRTGCLPCSGVSAAHVSATGGQCGRCDAGSQPNEELTGCESCISQSDSFWYSPDGSPCARCPPGQQPNTQRTACVACVGQYSPDGVQCLDCEPGWGPNNDLDGCESCTGIQYSPAGVCLLCVPPAMTDNAHIACNVPYECPVGTECAREGGCDEREHCTQCPTGWVSDGLHECVACDDFGKRANDAKSECVSCPPGTEPSFDRESCSACAGFNTSSFGIGCEECSFPFVVNDLKTTCLPCPAGTGPNENRTTCEACTGGTFSILGVCNLCPDGYEPAHDLVSCVDTNECLVNHGGCDRLMDDGTGEPCINEDGSFSCGDCPRGFEKTGGVNCTLPPPPPPPCSTCEIEEATVQPRATLEIMADQSVLVEGSPEQETFLQNLVNDLAASLGLLPSDIVIDPASLRTARRLQEGSQGSATILFDFVVTASGGAASIANLNEQLADPESELRNSQTTSALSPDQLAVPTFLCPARMVIPPGLTVCRYCEPGKEPNDPVEPTGCQLCSVSGAYLVSEAGTCHTCPAGTQPNEAMTACLNCDAGKFSSDGQLCLACPAAQAQNFARDGCVCANDFYNTSLGQIRCYTDGQQYEPTSVASAPICETCKTLECVTCTYDEDTRVNYVRMQRGFSLSEAKLAQRLPLEEVVGQRGVFPCVNDASEPNREHKTCGCSRALHVEEEPGTLNSGCADTATPCLFGYRGPLCAYCDEGFSRPGLKGECEQCSDTVSAIWIIFAAVVSLSFVVGVLYWVANVGGGTGKLSVIISLGKISVSLIQVLSQL